MNYSHHFVAPHGNAEIAKNYCRISFDAFCLKPELEIFCMR
jgi:hypothetical protein